MLLYSRSMRCTPGIYVKRYCTVKLINSYDGRQDENTIVFIYNSEMSDKI